jgi:hypothetical protein
VICFVERRSFRVTALSVFGNRAVEQVGGWSKVTTAPSGFKNRG